MVAAAGGEERALGVEGDAEHLVAEGGGAQGLAPGDLASPGLDLGLALVWAVGIACAVGAAYQAKYHRLAALILLGGAGLVTCVTFVWFSAPDLALTQLLVETVTTVLLPRED